MRHLRLAISLLRTVDNHSEVRPNEEDEDDLLNETGMQQDNSRASEEGGEEKVNSLGRLLP